MGYLANKKKEARDNAIFGSLILILGSLTLLTLGSTYSDSLASLAEYRFQYILILIFIAAVALYKLKFVTFLSALLFAFLNVAFISSTVRVFPEVAENSPTLAKISFYNMESVRPDYAKINQEIKKENPDAVIFINSAQDFSPEIRQAYPATEPYDAGTKMKLAAKIAPESKGEYDLSATKKIGWARFILNEQPLWILFGEVSKNSEEINALINFVNSHNEPVILLGSFNAVPWDDRLYLLKEKASLLYRGSLVSTYPSAFPQVLRLPYDHIYSHPSVVIKNVKSGSFSRTSHRPIIFEISSINIKDNAKQNN